MDLLQIGALVRKLRIERGLTLEQLASRCSITRQTLAAFERGSAADIGFRKVVRIVNALGLTIDVKRHEGGLPTLDDMYDLNEQEDREREEAFLKEARKIRRPMPKG
ncbi:helix-turn-helix transcriptional regulator [Castellaniella caeni]